MPLLPFPDKVHPAAGPLLLSAGSASVTDDRRCMWSPIQAAVPHSIPFLLPSVLLKKPYPSDWYTALPAVHQTASLPARSHKILPGNVSPSAMAEPRTVHLGSARYPLSWSVPWSPAGYPLCHSALPYHADYLSQPPCAVWRLWFPAILLPSPFQR